MVQLLLKFSALEDGFDRCHEVFNPPGFSKQNQVKDLYARPGCPNTLAMLFACQGCNATMAF